jgi:hypothetical protein
MPGGAAKVSIHGLVGREQREEQQQRRRAGVATGAAVLLLVCVAGLLSLQLSPDVPRGSTAAPADVPRGYPLSATAVSPSPTAEADSAAQAAAAAQA